MREQARLKETVTHLQSEAQTAPWARSSRSRALQLGSDDPCAEELVGQVFKDPHLAFAHGGRADFRGENGKYYAFLSAPGFAVNVRTEDATFTLHGGKLTVHGSFITEAHVVAQMGPR